MSTTFREVIEDVCGGISKKKELKVIHAGGVTGGFLPPSKADTPLDYESLLDAGVLMGQASFAAYDESACVIDLAKFSVCLLYTSPSPRDKRQSRMPSSA